MRLPDGYRLDRPELSHTPEILALVHASDIAAIGFADFDAAEVTEALTTPGMDPAEDAWLVRDPAAQLVGWGYFDAAPETAGEVYCEAYAHPGTEAPVQAALIELVLGRITARAAAAGRSEVLVKAAALPTETRYLDVLTAAGFELERQHARMTRPLAADEPRPEPVPGYTLRALREAELPECHELLRLTWADTAHPFHTPFAEFAAMPTIRWAESLVAETADGRMAGVAVSSGQSLEDNEGWVKWLGVLPEHRGRGLASALLRACFATFAAQGRSKVGLGVDTTNPTGAYRLYESLGMTVAYRANIYRQVLAV